MVASNNSGSMASGRNPMLQKFHLDDSAVSVLSTLFRLGIQGKPKDKPACWGSPVVTHTHLLVVHGTFWEKSPLLHSQN